MVPQFPGVIAKSATCWWDFVPYLCGEVFTLGYATWLGPRAACVAASHCLNDGGVYQLRCYDCEGGPLRICRRDWDKEDLYAAVLKTE
ncbi:MAG: hypothetical protein ACP5H5_08880 [Pyrobaculum sp.]